MQPLSSYSVEAQDHRAHYVEEDFEVLATIHLGPVSPDEVTVELYYGPLDVQREIVEGKVSAMRLEGSAGAGVFRYRGTLPCERSGMQGFTVRVVPHHPDTKNYFCTGLMTWR